MKRLILVAAALLGGLVMTASVFAHGGSGGMGRGMTGGGGVGMGHGLMGGGGMGMGHGLMGGGGMGPLAMHPELAQLPPEKQEQLRKLHLSMTQAMITKRAEIQVQKLALAETMRSFPLNQKSASEQWATVAKARKDIFDLRLGMMSQMQQAVGKELWEQIHSGLPRHGPGTTPGSGNMRPGMRGPRQPR